MAKKKSKEDRIQEEFVIDAIRGATKHPVDELLSQYTTSLEKSAPLKIAPDRTLPLTRTSMIFAHNAFNSEPEGAVFPNNYLSITEALDVGARGIELDLYWDNDDVRLCHVLCGSHVPELTLGGLKRLPGLGLGLNRPLSSALVEIRHWLDRNPDQLVILKLEDELDNAPAGTLSKIITNHFNRKEIFTPKDLYKLGKWPSIDAITSGNKQLIIMPQKTTGNPLMFDGNWGGGYKNSYESGTIARFRKAQYKFNPRETGGNRLLEVHEDRSSLGTIAKYAAQIPFLRDIIPAAGHISKEEITTLRNHGVNIISLDQLARNDNRLTPSTTLTDIRNSAYIFIPVAVIAGAFNAYKNKDNSWMSLTQKRLIQGLVATTLPDEEKIIYFATKDAVTEYRESVTESKTQNKANPSKVARASATFLSSGLESTIKTSMHNISGLKRTVIKPELTSGALLGGLVSLGQSLTNAVVVNLLVDPAIGAIKGIAKGIYGKIFGSDPDEKSGFVQGFAQGVDSSTLHSTDFSKSLSNIDRMFYIAAIRLEKSLKSHPELTSDEQKKEHYDNLVNIGKQRYLKNNPNTKSIDLIYPSFEEVNEYLKDNKAKINAEIEKQKESGSIAQRVKARKSVITTATNIAPPEQTLGGNIKKRHTIKK